MRLNTKFSLTVSLLALISIAIMAVMLISMSEIIKVNEYERNLLTEQNIFMEAMNYADMISVRGVDVNSLSSDWNKVRQKASDSMKVLQDHPARSFFTEEINENINTMFKYWNMIETEFQSMTDVYKEIENLGLSIGQKISISTHGFNYIINAYPNLPEIRNLDYAMTKAKRIVKDMNSSCESFEESIKKISEEITQQISHTYKIFVILAIGITLTVSICALLLATIITRRIVNRINNLKDLTGKLAQKDFSSRIEVSGDDEIYELSKDLNNMVGILNDFLIIVKKTATNATNSGQSINDSAVRTSSATVQIKSNTDSLGKVVDKLSAAINRSAGAIEEMIGVSGSLVTDNSNQASVIHESQLSVNNMAENLNEIALVAEEKTSSAQKIQRLVENGDEKIYSTYTLLQDINSQLDEIGEIVDIINDIAEQTNTLSMNAAIESAHAGEAGKGFGVVAEEIRQLAESTADNATRITSSLYSIVSSVKDANSTSKSAAEAFQLVSEQTKDLIISLTEITNSIRGIDNNMKEVTAKNNALSMASDEIAVSCDKLSAQQQVVSAEMETMHKIFSQVQTSINGIKSETSGIVSKMTDINSKSASTCNKMEQLSSVLSEFTTADYTLDNVVISEDDVFQTTGYAISSEQESETVINASAVTETDSVTETFLPTESSDDSGMEEIDADSFFDD